MRIDSFVFRIDPKRAASKILAQASPNAIKTVPIRRTQTGPERRSQAPIGGGVKRITDIVIAATALVLAAPLLVLLALAIRLQDGGPAVFGHQRIGHGGQPFRCLKLRSMVVNADAVLARHLATHPKARCEWNADRKLRNDPRVTLLGQFLRKTSLDELPQLINVLRGEMSLVGPRPVTASELEFYGEAAAHYTAARPGITGLWQVSGRNDVSYEARIRFDSDYVVRWSFARDLKIVLLTVPAVVLSRGTY